MVRGGVTFVSSCHKNFLFARNVTKTLYFSKAYFLPLNEKIVVK